MKQRLQAPTRGRFDPLTALLTVCRGFVMGSADVVPGVSGGTMAFILGIYPRLLTAIRAVDLGLARLLWRGQFRDAATHVDLRFLLALGAGIVAALLFFTRVVPLPALIESDPEPVYSLFFGLIVASIVVLLRDIGRPRGGDFSWLAAGAVFGLAVVNMVPVQTPDAAWFVFLAGALAISAMILPGISGSFVLLLLNKYSHVFGAIGRLDFSVLLPFALGCAAGLMAFSRVLMWMLEQHYRRALLGIMGMLTGTLWSIWPFQQRVTEVVAGELRVVGRTPVVPSGSTELLLLCAGLALAGVVAVLLVHTLATRAKEPGA